MEDPEFHSKDHRTENRTQCHSGRPYGRIHPPFLQLQGILGMPDMSFQPSARIHCSLNQSPSWNHSLNARKNVTPRFPGGTLHDRPCATSHTGRAVAYPLVCSTLFSSQAQLGHMGTFHHLSLQKDTECSRSCPSIGSPHAPSSNHCRNF